MVVGDYVGVYRGTPDRFDSYYWDWKKIDLPWLVNQLSDSMAGNWSLMSEYFFKSKQRDPHMGSGVAHVGFERLVNLLIGREVLGKAVDMVLSGHTHQSIEFRLTMLDDDIIYSHDYYLDNTIHGLSAREFWRELRDPNKWDPEVLSTDVCRDTGSEEFIASCLSESPTGQVRLMESILERNNMRRAVSV